MGRTSELRREIKRVFVPVVIAKGFALEEKRAPAFWEFRRKSADAVDLFEIQWEKYGRPRFRVNFATCPPNGVAINGKTLSADEVLATWLPEFGSLQPRRGSSSANWFRQDKPLVRRLWSSAALYPASQVVGVLKELFPELESYWATGSIGPHLRIVRLGGG